MQILHDPKTLIALLLQLLLPQCISETIKPYTPLSVQIAKTS